MIIAGVHARVAAKRFEVALVVVDALAGGALGHSLSRAPAGEDPSGQLHELGLRAGELFSAHGAQRVVLWPSDPGPGGAAQRAAVVLAARADGAVLAAAGATGFVTAAEFISGPAVRAAGGGGATADAVDALCAACSDLPADESVRRAAAGALAWFARR